MAEFRKDPGDEGYCWLHQGEIALARRRPNEAAKHFDRALTLVRQVRNSSREMAFVLLIGQAWESAGDWRRALAMYQMGVKLAAEVKIPVLEATARKKLGFAHYHLGNHTAAEPEYAAAQELFRKQGVTNEVITLLILRAVNQDQLSEPGKGLPLLEEALRLASEAGLTAEETRILIMIGLTQSQADRHDQARIAFARAVTTARKARAPDQEVEALIWLGKTLDKQKQMGEAVKTFEAALTLARRMRDPRLEAQVLLDYGTVLSERGKPEEAVRLLLAARKHSRLLGPTKEPVLLYALARAYDRQGESSQAERTWADGIALARKTGQLMAERDLLLARGLYYYERQQPLEARADHEAALTLTRRLPRSTSNRSLEATILTNLGWMKHRDGFLTEARQQAEEAVGISAKSANKGGELAALTLLAVIERDEGALEASEARLKEVLRQARELGNRGVELGALEALATIAERRARWSEARVLLGQALRAYTASGNDTPAVAVGLEIRLANLDNQAGRADVARQQLERLLQQLDPVRQPQLHAQVLASLGSLLASQGELGPAVRNLRSALEVYRKINYRWGEADLRARLGQIYLSTHLHEEAEADLREAIRLYTELRQPLREAEARLDLSVALIGTAMLHWEKGGRDKFKESLVQVAELQRCLDLQKKAGDRVGFARTATRSGQILYALSRFIAELKATNPGATDLPDPMYDEALQGLENAEKLCLRAGDRFNAAVNRSTIGHVYMAMRKYPEALAAYTTAHNVFEKHGTIEHSFQSWRNIAQAHEASGRWDAAITAYRRSLERLEELRTRAQDRTLQMGVLDRALHPDYSPYLGLARCLLARPGREREAFAVSEQAKARALTELLSGSQTTVTRGLTLGERQREETLRNQLTSLAAELEAVARTKDNPTRTAELREQLASVRREYDAFRRDLYLRHPDLQIRRAEFAPSPPNGLPALPAGTVILSYLVGGQETLLFVLRAERSEAPPTLTVLRLPVGERQLTEWIQGFRDVCTSPDGGVPEDTKLYDALLAPAAEALAQAKRLIVIPDGPLHALPFHALPYERQGEKVKYLIERFPVSNAPSVAALASMRQLGERLRKARPERDSGSLLAVGISQFDRREQPLPAAEPEAKAVAAQFGERGEVLLGPNATRDRLQATWKGRRYLHFATHGRLNEVAPFYSALVLTQSKGQDEGLLYARDLLDTELTAELVVLSACNSGRGRFIRGEGVLGLNWAWFVAGVPATVTTHWLVADQSTAQLMGVFYQQLSQGVLPAEALRQAQLALVKNRATRHPYFWAPFALNGDPGE